MLTLRPIEPEDLDFAYLIENDLSMWNVSSATAPVSRFQLHQFITQSEHDLHKDRQIRLVIDVDGEPVGFADLFNYDPLHQRAEIGLVVAKTYSGKGYGHQALEKLAHYAKHSHLHQLYAIVSRANTHCLNILQECDYHPSASFKDWLFDGTEYTDAILLQKFL